MQIQPYNPLMNGNKQIVALVLGMHRSGTSALTGMLDKFGACVPLTKDTVVSADNPKGHWEHRGINKINDQILRHFGQTWTTWQSLDLDQTPRELINALEGMLKNLIEEAEGLPVVFKDPRISILLPLWLRVLEKLEMEVKLFFCIRHPDAVAKSLQKRNQLCYERGLLLWLHYNFQSLQFIGNKPSYKIIFPAWLEDPESLYHNTSEILGIRWPVAWPQCSDNAISFVDTHLVHNQKLSKSDHPLLERCLMLFRLLERAPASGPDGSQKNEIESMKEQVLPWMNVCASVVLDERELWRKKINEMYYLINRNI